MVVLSGLADQPGTTNHDHWESRSGQSNRSDSRAHAALPGDRCYLYNRCCERGRFDIPTIAAR